MRQEEYFSVHLGLTINVEPLPNGKSLPNFETFSTEIPPLFRIASECNTLEENAERLLAGFGKEDSKALVTYLSAQNNKINLLLSYVLSQQDNANYRYITETFGASKLSFYSPHNFTVRQNVIVKLFLDHPAAAIYCYAEVVNCSALDDRFLIELHYTRLLEDDRDLLIRAALHCQQKLLRQRAQQRNMNNNNDE
ncbi:PilZ domain-containing protein [Photobacterium phosphoreum]|uniref:PilZ domain-containing protein n=1 Tax=Photobacterium phosphoreum TaxID=659 RepID=A0A2T3JYB5_PHOPO|nr:PilZ domain-containing protein [Photobacterium phosphoreum]PSU27347.1 PilZ domain-containing protein [Photobacterium phosphoreum]PSU43889.1 PilZ domain-containing protein [Photobacterium phosphoreum]PSU54378.1 PilZ domain-containing protein [Photobacterium phosphoreum]